MRFFPKIFRPYLDIRGVTRLDLFTSTCFCLSWCVAASVILGANSFWLRSIYFDAVQDHRLSLDIRNALQLVLDILGGHDLLDGAFHIQTIGVVAGVGLAYKLFRKTLCRTPGRSSTARPSSSPALDGCCSTVTGIPVSRTSVVCLYGLVRLPYRTEGRRKTPCP